jgi:hypothetical protein
MVQKFQERDLEAGEPFHFISNARPDRGCDLGEVEPILDDHVEVESEAVAVCRDSDPLCQLVAGEQPLESLAGHADNAVALGGGVPDDLCDRVRGDPDLPEVGLLCEGVLLHDPRA